MIVRDGSPFFVILLLDLRTSERLKRIQPPSQADLFNPQKLPGTNEAKSIEHPQHDGNSLNSKRIITIQQQAYAKIAFC